jgi:hypothetical protein
MKKLLDSREFCNIEEQISFETSNEVIAWLSCRNSLFRSFVAKQYYDDVTYATKSNVSIKNIFVFLFHIIKSIFYILRLRKITTGAKVVFITGANKSYYHSSNDAFVEYLHCHKGENCTVVSLGKDRLNAKYSLFGIIIISKILSKLISNLSNFGLCNFLARIEKLCTANGLNFSNKKIIENFLFFKILYFFVNVAFRSCKIEEVWIEEGHYQNYIAINSYFKQHGAIVTEHQHGMIHYANEVYMYPKSLSNLYKEFLPDALGVFGIYWMRFINIPGNVFCIGAYKHYKYKSSDGVSYFYDDNKYTKVVYLGTGFGLRKNITRFKLLQKNNPHLTVVFRPHPMERKIIKKYLNKGDISNNDLISDLKDANFVVGDLSTVLFEAILYDCKPIIEKTNIASASGLLSDFESVSDDMLIITSRKHGLMRKNDLFAII